VNIYSNFFLIARAIILLESVFHLTQANAGFFIPKGTTMAMATYSPTESMAEIAYGLSRDTSMALGMNSMTDAARSYRWTMAQAQVTQLVGRTFTESGIGNAYVYAGPLAARGTTFNGTRLGVHGGVWADYESRRIYARVSWHGYRTSAFTWNASVAQIAVAPYLADYEDVASWGGVQLKRRTGQTQIETTPFVRFFKKTSWIDVGVSVNRVNRKDVFINFMQLF
jgi:hypothetical protein